ncbi:unnamed protein product [Citrullus colocynthis]|uniref:Uncharacterized protein n=1 Tax=Citrullus colocynthis TaxID=252529 RepID=A0ABP0YNK2_9ROSI
MSTRVQVSPTSHREESQERDLKNDNHSDSMVKNEDLAVVLARPRRNGEAYRGYEAAMVGGEGEEPKLDLKSRSSGLKCSNVVGYAQRVIKCAHEQGTSVNLQSIATLPNSIDVARKVVLRFRAYRTTLPHSLKSSYCLQA